jgi:hypothetical protein
MVDAWRRRPWCSPWRRQDLLAASALAKRDGHADRHEVRCQQSIVRLAGKLGSRNTQQKTIATEDLGVIGRIVVGTRSLNSWSEMSRLVRPPKHPPSRLPCTSRAKGQAREILASRALGECGTCRVEIRNRAAAFSFPYRAPTRAVTPNQPAHWGNITLFIFRRVRDART